MAAVMPGDLVYSRRMSARCASGYEVDGSEARLVGSYDTWEGQALVVAVIAPEAKGLGGSGLIAVFLSRRQRIVFTWATSVWPGP